MDTAQIIFAIIQTLILMVTAYIAWKAPIEAVKVGRKLSQEQQRQDAKMTLFLTLFGQRSDPVRQDFVDGLNQINVVFSDVSAVLNAWKEYQNSLNQTNIINQDKKWQILRVNLLSEMATHLGYFDLKQTSIEEHYYPVGHGNRADVEMSLRLEAIQYLKSGNELYRVLIENAMNSQLPENEEESEKT